MSEVNTLAIDLETYSEIDIQGCGNYRYTEDHSFEILLFAYSVNEEETYIIDLAQGEVIPENIVDMILDETVIKTAFNANFERTCLSKYLGVQLRPESWRCTAVQSAILALPATLEGVGMVLGLDKKKMTEGKELIKYFCCPVKATKVNGGRTRNMPSDAPEKWLLFKKYCVRDVDVEKLIRQKLTKFPIPDHEQELYCMDQRIADRGIMVDMTLVNHAVECDEQYKERALKRAVAITSLDNPNSVTQLRAWLSEHGVKTDSLAKDTVKELVDSTDGVVKEMLQIRLETSKTSVKKYEAIQKAVCKSSRVKGLLKFYGANRTGRFAGKLVQIHNLPKNFLPDIELAREILCEGGYEELEMLFSNVPNTLSELIRTAFIAKPGCRFIVSDFSAIEARVLAWLANEEWRIQAFEEGADIYCKSASVMFHCTVEKNGENGHLRSKGKISELALGYGGSVGALTAMGALQMGLTEDELPDLVSTWRNANTNITAFWWKIDEAAIQVIKEKTSIRIGKVTLFYKSGMMFISLPSGRNLAYVKPKIGINKFGRESITYEGIGESRKWMRMESYGPKICENITQAVARDILCESMLRIEKAGFDIVCHVHDEVVLEVPNGVSSVEEINQIMSVAPEWADGLPLAAAGFESPFYKKD